MSDNTTIFTAKDYDAKVRMTLPFYDFLYPTILDLVRCAEAPTDRWLDTGCGTGTFGVEAGRVFSDARFTLADPSPGMLNVARGKLGADKRFSFMEADSASLDFDGETFDVVTAIQCHHYLDVDSRKRAVANCFRMLKPGGLFIVFENIRPLTERGTEIGRKSWAKFQLDAGMSPERVLQHRERFDNGFFPVTVTEHLNLLRETGFGTVEILWFAVMQAGFYAIK